MPPAPASLEHGGGRLPLTAILGRLYIVYPQSGVWGEASSAGSHIKEFIARLQLLHTLRPQILCFILSSESTECQGYVAHVLRSAKSNSEIPTTF